MTFYLRIQPFENHEFNLVDNAFCILEGNLLRGYLKGELESLSSADTAHISEDLTQITLIGFINPRRKIYQIYKTLDEMTEDIKRYQMLDELSK